MTRRTIQADRMLPVTEEERATYETERTSALRVIGHLDVQWTKLRKQFAERQKEAEKARATAGDQEASAAQDLGDGSYNPDAERRHAGARVRRIAADARIGKLFRWKRDIGAGVRGRVRLFADRVVEIEKILVSGFHEVSVEISMDGLGGAVMTRGDTGEVLPCELSLTERQKLEPRSAAERTIELPFLRAVPNDAARERGASDAFRRATKGGAR